VRLAIDIGGTFTDVVLDKAGHHHAAKVLTTHGRPAVGFMAGVQRVLEETHTRPDEIALILHGTTLATNALIERNGATTALIVTEGHRDSLEMAHENRFDQYDIHAERRAPLVPRALRLPVSERVNFRGRVLVPLGEDSVERLVPILAEAEVKSVAIGLLHAYANPSHERRIREILSARLPELSFSLSSEVCPEIREYERQSTTAANAYVRPLIAAYLEDLKSQLGSAGLGCPCLLMTSAGTLVTIETAQAHPIRLVESGPAGGAILAADVARRLGEDRVLSFDMGGTTAKICLIDQGQPLLSRTMEVDRAHRFVKGSGLPLKIPVVEMVEIGAGGGSVASVDAMNRIQVGPESAGSEPGPACYGRGGGRMTVTDADLLLGRLHPDEFAGGSLRLDGAAAEAAARRSIGDALNLDSLSAASGVIEIVDENMAGAARVHAAERGKEIDARTMIAFGGAAPLHAARLAEKLGIGRIVIPANAGVGSAVGFLIAPVAYEVVRSRYQRLSALDLAELAALFDEMEVEAEGVVRLAVPEGELAVECHAYARYVGQGHEIKIVLPPGRPDASLVGGLRRAYETEYARQYGRTVPGLEVEVLTWSVSVVAARPSAVRERSAARAGQETVGDRRRLVYFSGREEAQAAGVVHRSALGPGDRITGPAVITESQTTTILPEGIRATLTDDGDLVLERSTAAVSPVVAGQGIREQIIWNRLISIVEEQAQALIRTAFSTTVREAGDLSAGVFDLSGRMLAQAVTGTPGHVNAMATSVGYFLQAIPITEMADGDVYLTNDPWLGTGHLFDFTVLTPVFQGGAPVALFASTVHVVDIGGPGFGPDAGQVYEEGLCIPILPLFRAGTVDESVLAIIRANVREPVQVVGDLYSLTTCNLVGASRLLEMMREFGLNRLDGIGNHIIETSRGAMQAEIAKLPMGVYENAMTVDGYGRPVDLVARMTISEDAIQVDFDGTSPVSPYGINVPLSYAQAYASFGIRCVLGGSIPNNAGSLEPIQVTAPEGSILNAQRPAAVAVRHVIGQMLPDVVLGCLDRAVPGIAPAEGSSSLWNPMLSGGPGMVGDQEDGDGEAFSVTIFHSGGMGARPGHDGLAATAFPSGVRNTPVEITESVAPVIFWRKEYRVGSGGSGRYRGGDGQIIEIAHAEGAPFAVFALFDRIDHPARGRHGGGDGAPGRIALSDGTLLKGKGKQIIPRGRRLVLELPGGGGLGEPI
jgi:N-methylhydantoinase A/oxoprolinase/acetone carboxylase beta subunit/N-methylhydantoinase B/oxoprolinase/acetone carboxylase alpha subunit